MPEKVKIFNAEDFLKGQKGFAEYSEATINEWLATQGDIQITDRLISPAGNFFWLAIFYIEKPPKNPAKAAQPSRARGKLKLAK